MIKLTTETKALERKLSWISKNLFGRLERAMEQIGKLLEKETKRNVSNRLLRIRSGRLLGSIKHNVFTPPGMVVLEVSSDTPYSRIQDQGGRAGRGGSVRIKPTRYMSRTLEDKKRQISNILHKAIKRAIK